MKADYMLGKFGGWWAYAVVGWPTEEGADCVFWNAEDEVDPPDKDWDVVEPDDMPAHVLEDLRESLRCMEDQDWGDTHDRG